MTESPATPNEAAFAPRDKRLTTILLVGKLSVGTRDDLCRVRNISTGGMRLETLAPIAVGQQLEVELKNGVTVRARVVWVRDAEAGVQFEDPVNIEKVLAPAEPSKRGTGAHVTRSPRLSARCPVALRRDGHIRSALLTDISQGGTQLHWNGPGRASGRIGDPVVLFVPGLASRRAMVRWIKEDSVGLSFVEKLGFAELAQWLAGPDRFALAAPGHGPTAGALSQTR